MVDQCDLNLSLHEQPDINSQNLSSLPNADCALTHSCRDNQQDALVKNVSDMISIK